ncbi:MAG: alpha/beta hydrolase domain-containing protein [Pseudomonadota bacterium]
MNLKKSLKVFCSAGTVIAALCMAGCNNPFSSKNDSAPATPAIRQVGAPPVCTPTPGLTPTVIGPIASDPVGSASHNYPWSATAVDLAAHGYVEEEYFICGYAPSQAGTYTTRMIVRRPFESKNFNGTVFAEWLNVSLGYDAEILWAQSYEHIMRSGIAYIGIAAQRSGHYTEPYGTAAWSPLRYSQLIWPSENSLASTLASVPVPLPIPTALIDPASFDIYTQGLQAIRASTGIKPLGGLPVRFVIATGGSQSTAALDLYYVTQQPLFKAADAFMPFILSSGSIGIQDPASVLFPVPADVVGTPVLQVNSETDIANLKQPDSALFKLWEVSGATHYDQNQFLYERPLRTRDLDIDIADNDSFCADTPRSRILFRNVLNAAMNQVQNWLQTGQAPPSQPGFQYGSDRKLLRDAQGNALGGIRLPEQAVPTGTNSRENPGGSFCSLYGSYKAFDATTLRELYRSEADYLTKFDAATAAAIKSGVLLEDDAKASQATARSITILR